MLSFHPTPPILTRRVTTDFLCTFAIVAHVNHAPEWMPFVATTVSQTTPHRPDPQRHRRGSGHRSVPDRYHGAWGAPQLRHAEPVLLGLPCARCGPQVDLGGGVMVPALLHRPHGLPLVWATFSVKGMPCTRCSPTCWTRVRLRFAVSAETLRTRYEKRLASVVPSFFFLDS